MVVHASLTTVSKVRFRYRTVTSLTLPSSHVRVHLLLFITRKYTIINANLKLINAKIFILFNRHSLAQIRNHLHQSAFHSANWGPLTPFHYTLGIKKIQLRNIFLLRNFCWRYRMPFDANGCVSTLMNIDWITWMYFGVNEFEVGVNDSIFSGNERQKMYVRTFTHIVV